VIAADSGKTYVPTTAVAPAFTVDGLRVSFKVGFRPDLAASPAGLPVDVLTLAPIMAPGP
jgi:hypothetical protein